jgi:multidrug efflux pump subunit AcrA (membrane-fusion protein)
VAVCLVVLAILGGLKYVQVSTAIAFGKSFPERSETVTAVIATPVSWQQRYRAIGEVRATRHGELRPVKACGAAVEEDLGNIFPPTQLSPSLSVA